MSKTKPEQHRTKVLKVGARYQPICSCGWEGIDSQHESVAEQNANDHIVAAASHS